MIDKKMMTHKYKRFKRVSDIRIKRRLMILFIILFLPVMMIVAVTSYTIYREEKNTRMQTEKTVMNVAEQYVNTSIENIVAIAKAVYTNNTLYNFLNVRYKTSVDYYDAFYKLNDNNSLVVAENSNIRNFTVLTDNDTIMEGGNIKNLSKEKDKPWYNDFKALNKNMIVYCDSANNRFSLIRTLDYYSLNTGEAILIIDFNNTNLQRSFENLDFDGQIYVVSNDTVIYSNIKELSNPDIETIKSCDCLKMNYYTSNVEYYIRTNKKATGAFLKKQRLYVPAFIVLIISSVCAFLLMKNMSVRIRRISDICCEKKIPKDQDIYFGKDEIGELYKSYNDTIIDLNDCKSRYDQLNESFEAFRKQASVLFITTFDFEARFKYMEKTNSALMTDKFKTERLISFERELSLIREFMEQRNGNESFSYSINTNIKDIAGSYILSFSVSMIADDLVRRILTLYPRCELFITAEESAQSCIVEIRDKVNELPPNIILKLSAIFESDPDNLDFIFNSDDEFNPYIRLKNYYENDLEVNIISDNETTLRFIFKKEVITGSRKSKKNI